MPSLKEVKNRISSVQSTQQITRAMKMVAASKLRKSQERIFQLRPYAEKLGQIISNVSASLDQDVNSEYAEKRTVNKVLLVVFSSDRGLCGAFNSNIFKKARKVIAENYADAEAAKNLYILPVGTKASAFFKKRNYQVIDDYAELYSDHSFDNVEPAASYVLDQFVAGEYDEVVLVYNAFKNVATQIQTATTLLPIGGTDDVDDSKEGANTHVDYILEPSVEYILEVLIPRSLKIQFYRAFLESAASEQGARMTAMDQATDNAGELLNELKLTYNRTRQAAITKEILEIVGGADALSG